MGSKDVAPGLASRVAEAEVRERITRRIVGRSSEARRLRDRIQALASIGVPVLVSGESGSGRSTVVETLHSVGCRATGSLERVSAGSCSPRLSLPRRGGIHLAGVEALPREAQRLCLATVRSGDPRIRIFASTSDPFRLSDPRRFDTDLGRILQRFHLRIPPLRERLEDVGPLAAHFCDRLGPAIGRGRIRVSSGALDVLVGHRWPGNLRELEEVLGRAIAFSSEPVIDRSLMKEILVECGESLDQMRRRHAAHERERLLEELRATGGNVSRTAESLGKSRSAVYRMIEKHHIRLSRQRARPAGPTAASRSGDTRRS